MRLGGRCAPSSRSKTLVEASQSREAPPKEKTSREGT